jgi:adhesin/invasin
MTLSLAAVPGVIPADGASASTVTATVRNGSGVTVAGDSVQFATVVNVPGSCGILVPATGITNALGQVSVTYTASAVPGGCTVKATEAQSGAVGSVSITQTAVPNSVIIMLTPSSIPANGTSTSTVAVTVKSGVTGAPIPGDTVIFALMGSPPGVCGTLVATTGTTNAVGQLSTTYLPSTTPGFCAVTATETLTGGRGSATITQTYNPVAVGIVVTVTASPSSVHADGVSTSTISATVTGPASAAMSNVPVMFTLSGTPGACGSVAPATGFTNASGVVAVTYRASTTPGFCTVTAVEAASGGRGSVTITQVV